MRHLLVSLICAAPLTGCILETELCGSGFVETEAGGCAPEEPAPPYYSDAGFDLGADIPIIVEPEPIPEPIPEPLEPESAEPDPPEPDPPEPDPPEPEPAFDPWEGREMLLIVDRSDQISARSTPASPGYDLDAIVIVSEIGEFVAVLGFWEAAQVNDPFNLSDSVDPSAAVGEPDANDELVPDRFVSLGTEGGFVQYGLDLSQPIRSGHTMTIFEANSARGNEAAEVYMCFPGRLDLSLCRSAGIVQGTGQLTLR